MSFVFITYVPADTALARTLARGLEIYGFSTWYRWRDGCHGPSLVGQNERCLAECAAVVAVVSPAALRPVAMAWFGSDLERSQNRGKPLLPVLNEVSAAGLRHRTGEAARMCISVESLALPPGDPWEEIPRIATRLAVLGVPRRLRTDWPPEIAALIQRFRLPAVDLRQPNAVDPDCAGHLDREWAETYTALPIACTGATIVALGDPARAPEVAAAGNFGMFEMEPVIADPAAIRELIPWCYGDEANDGHPGETEDC